MVDPQTFTGGEFAGRRGASSKAWLKDWRPWDVGRSLLRGPEEMRRRRYMRCIAKKEKRKK